MILNRSKSTNKIAKLRFNAAPWNREIQNAAKQCRLGKSLNRRGCKILIVLRQLIFVISVRYRDTDKLAFDIEHRLAAREYGNAIYRMECYSNCAADETLHVFLKLTIFMGLRVRHRIEHIQ